MNRRDDEIKTEIVNRIHWDTRVDAANVLVEVDKGLVSLMGNVPNSGARRAAFGRAKEVRGVRIVDNQLTVFHPSKDGLPNDKTLAEKAKSVLEWNSDIDNDLITVNVKSGVVELSGSVKWYWQRQKAEDLVSDLRGVISVNNRLDILPAEKIDDEIIAREIISELDRSSDMNEEKVEVAVKDGIVTLGGTVSCYAAEKHAYDAAAHTAGVIGIINNIQIEFI